MTVIPGSVPAFDAGTGGGGHPSRHARANDVDARRRWKRVVDVVTAAGLLVLLSPVLLGTTVAIGLTSRGPVLYRQIRVGRDGRPFQILKFRSMYVDADERMSELLPLNEREGPVFKVREDPRCTRVGRWIRRASIDELPQLLNVLMGHMSIVGPRPPLPTEVRRYTEYERRRLAVLPGITGMPQVNGRADLSFSEALEQDLRYVDSWSLGLDVEIMVRTVGAVFTRRGAY